MMTTSFLQKNIPVLTDVILPKTPKVEASEPAVIEELTDTAASAETAADSSLPILQPALTTLAEATLPAAPAEVMPIEMPSANISPISAPKKTQALAIAETETAPVEAPVSAIDTMPSETTPAVAEVDSGVLWAHWKDEITENVMQTLLTEIDKNITQTVQSQLQGALASLSTSIAAQIKSNLEQALQETVTQAIEEELLKFKN